MVFEESTFRLLVGLGLHVGLLLAPFLALLAPKVSDDHWPKPLLVAAWSPLGPLFSICRLWVAFGLHFGLLLAPFCALLDGKVVGDL